MPFSFAGTLGRRTGGLNRQLPAALDTAALTLDTPVGVGQDARGNVWIADAGNNRLLVVDGALERVLAVVGGRGTEPGAFDLPFRIAHHPTERALFVTDLGNGRVQRLAYDYRDGAPTVTGVETFRPADGAAFHPNGVAVHRYDDGLRVFVADEFYHEGDDLRGRIAVFDGTGDLVRSIRAVASRHHGPIPLYWPQGLAVDEDGHLLVANMGSGVLTDDGALPAYFATVVRCDRTSEGVPFEETGHPTVPKSLVTPRGVSVLGDGEEERIAVPDVGGRFVHLYDTAPGHTSEVPATIAPGLDDRRFRSPMQVAPYEAPGRRPPDDLTARVLVSEGLDHTVSAYDLETISESKDRLARVASDRSGTGQFDFAGGVAGLSARGGQRLLIADADNARLQITDADGRAPLTTLPLSANRFPVGIDCWTVEPGRGYCVVADYSLAYDADNDDPQIAVYEVDCRGHPAIEHVTSAGTWGIWGNNCRLPWGLAVEGGDGHRARVLVTDSLNGRLQWWTFDRSTGTLRYDDDAGGFGHGAGDLWNPSDVAVGERGTYVADRNNNRLQRYDGDAWHVHGEAGYGTDGDRLLLPQSVAAVDGYVFVVDLVNRAIKVYEEVDREGGALVHRDTMRAFGGDHTEGDLWMPYMLHASARDGHVALAVPDAVLNVVYRYRFTPA